MILMDLRLPEVDGWTLTRLARQDPRTAQRPDRRGIGERPGGGSPQALDSGADVFLAKPCDLDEIVRHIQSPAARVRPGKNYSVAQPDEPTRRQDCSTPAVLRRSVMMAYGQANRSPHRDRPRASQGRRSRPRPCVLQRCPRLRDHAAHGKVGRLSERRWLPSPHRAEHVGESPRRAARGGNDRSLSLRDPLRRSRGARRRAPPAAATRASASKGRATTESARRSTFATPMATASSSTGTGRVTSGRGQATARCAW